MKELTLSKEPFLIVRVPSVTPSLNALFSMNHWQRATAKKKIQAAFISALRQEENDLLTPTISFSNTTLTASAMLEQFQMTVKAMSQSKLTKKKLAGKRRR
jgi:hypothetical protein